jgi:NAD(P)H-dependent flavin oxidoreductase YrpB (nitropropane dioxygenase family)
MTRLAIFFMCLSVSLFALAWQPKMLQENIDELKAHLVDKNAPFGVDLLLPQVGGSARKTNYDYSKGQLPELIDIIVASGCKLFVAAVGVPPKFAVDKLHAAGIIVMNMIGAPKHVPKAIDAGVDIICAQGGEGGGHTGEVATSILIPKVVDLCKGHMSPLTGKQIEVVAAGGIFDGRSLAMALSLGASAVWVGTRFVAATEAGAPPRHQKGVVEAGYHDTVRTIIFTGRPMRVLKSPYIMDWEDNKAEEIKSLTSQGKLPAIWDGEQREAAGNPLSFKERMEMMPLLMGQVAGAISDVQPASQIMSEMVNGCIEALRSTTAAVTLVSKL